MAGNKAQIDVIRKYLELNISLTNAVIKLEACLSDFIPKYRFWDI